MTEHSELRIVSVQPEILWQNIRGNLEHYRNMTESFEDADIFVFPEMFATGFTFDISCAKESENEILDWMRVFAAKKKAVAAGSIFIKENDCFHNRFYWVRPDGSHSFYDKHFLFRLSPEAELFSPGNEKLVVEEKSWKIALRICYDLRFPDWSANAYSEDVYDYDLLIYTASWPEARIKAWETLLRARAIENSAYCMGVNRIGKDGFDILYGGSSLCADPKGNLLTESGKTENCNLTVLSADELIKYRRKYPFALDWER